MRIITDEKELQSCKLKELLGPIKPYMSQEEADLIKAANDENDRRTLVIEYYKKYIDKAVTEAGEDPEALKKVEEAPTPKKKPEPVEKEVTPHVAPPQVNKTELVDESIPGLELSDHLSCVIRDMPGKNGTSTQSVETLLELMFRHPSGRVIFGRPSNIDKVKAKAFIELVKNCKKVKGMHNITEAQKLRVIKNIKVSNLIAN